MTKTKSFKTYMLDELTLDVGFMNNRLIQALCDWDREGGSVHFIDKRATGVTTTLFHYVRWSNLWCNYYTPHHGFLHPTPTMRLLSWKYHKAQFSDPQPEIFIIDGGLSDGQKESDKTRLAFRKFKNELTQLGPVFMVEQRCA